MYLVYINIIRSKTTNLSYLTHPRQTHEHKNNYVEQQDATFRNNHGLSSHHHHHSSINSGLLFGAPINQQKHNTK